MSPLADEISGEAQANAWVRRTVEGLVHQFPLWRPVAIVDSGEAKSKNWIIAASRNFYSIVGDAFVAASWPEAV